MSNLSTSVPITDLSTLEKTDKESLQTLSYPPPVVPQSACRLVRGQIKAPGVSRTCSSFQEGEVSQMADMFGTWRC